ncbi:ATP-grasp fold amidoligase family protein [Salimicrobium album]|uniref:TupA-like ATPgrasp n=1 Tax=Salimicrobium album TaxID=50717 RepID=A0A1H3EKL0_9BACI|nr:ATP-grasp fold amidoligase family protein [Salimicrobium album]SDX79211.1 TupA-like ATPgrasp [Salimicrobium album]
MFFHLKNKIRNVSKKSKIVSKMYLIANSIKIFLLRKMDDEKFAKLKYKENTGKNLNLENPVTFNEKLWWLKLNNRDPLLTICSDKYKVRCYVKEKGLEEILIPLYGVYSDANDIQFESLPNKAFIKTNHGSGNNVLWDKENPFNTKKFIKKFNRSLKENYYLQSREWNYKNIEPRIIIEKVLMDKKELGLVDYKFLCFDGEVKMVFSEVGIASNDGTHNPYSTRNVHDRDFNLLNIKVGRKNFDSSLLVKPPNYYKMVEYAEALAEPFAHCRVDLFNIEGNIYFGEITFYHGGGTQKVEPEEWSIKMGEWIDLNSSKIKLSTSN